MRERKPIFYDAQRRRWRRTRRVLEVTGGLFALLLIVFFFDIIGKPQLPEIILPEARPGLHAVRQKRAAKPVSARPGRHRRIAALGKVPENYDPLRAAFYVTWDSTSLSALQRHHSELDLVIPELLHALSPDGRLNVDRDARLSEWMASTGVELPMMALVNNFDGSVWRSRELEELLARRDARRRLIGELELYATSTRQEGLVLDFEDVPPASQPDYHAFVAELAAALHRVDRKLIVALPANNQDYGYARIAQVADAIILMNYDQHWSGSVPGPIVAHDWFLRNVEEARQHVPPEKLIVAVANYAYDWALPKRGPRPPAHAVSFQQALITAQESEATVEFDPDSLSPNYSYSDEAGVLHQVWMLDGVTAYNQERAVERAGLRGVALWRLGSEDPSLWSIWDATQADEASRARLDDMPPGYDLVLEADGDIWRITGTPQSGRRQIRYDAASEAIISENIVAFPMSYRIDQMGAVPKKIAITFDDGPDPRFTPHVLDILKAKQVPATFFVTGISASDYPALLQRIYDEGHEIGNHTYTHPRFDRMPRAQLAIELNLTARLLAGRLGIKTVLFRPPYGIDHQPEAPEEVELLPFVQQQGYVVVGARIDPHDWGEAGGAPPPPAGTIAARVLEQVAANKGNIVLMHDGGGDRSHTVEALPLIIDRLHARGFELVSISSLLGQTRASTMLPLAPGERWRARADAFIFNLYHWLRLGIAGVFILGIFLVSARALVVGLLAVIERMRANPEFDPAFRPRVSVLIPAYNEEEVIAETLRSVLASEYEPLEVLVVDDGSTDRTAERVDAVFGNHPRVRFLQQPNSGKAAALNHALELATGAVVVTIDADTAVEPDAIAKLVRHFADPGVGAVAGNAKVANRDRWLTRWQALEYITSQNLEKRAFDLLNCITVVPGAIGAWSAAALRACGGFTADTVAEDADLTLGIRRRGWRITYDEEAIGHTQAPDTAGALIRQRFRWTFGTLQAVWKHRDTLGRPRYGTLGWIGLPNIFLFQILLPLFSPVIDLLFLGSLGLWALAHVGIARIPQLWTSEDVQRAMIFFVVFMVIDLLTCVLAFALEKKEDWTLLAPLLLQRFYYRQMMYFVLFRALMWAVQGQAVGWGHVQPRPTTVAHA